MIDFACKKFRLGEVIKCSLGLTRSELALMEMLMKNDKYYTTEDLSKKMGLDLSTIQRAVKKLHEKEIVERRQNNLGSGGYLFLYRIRGKQHIEKVIMDIIQGWVDRVQSELRSW